MGDADRIIDDLLARRCEWQTMEVKSAHGGSPKVYDTLSSFSNQQDGGVIVFGVDESNGYKLVGVVGYMLAGESNVILLKILLAVKVVQITVLILLVGKTAVTAFPVFFFQRDGIC